MKKQREASLFSSLLLLLLVFLPSISLSQQNITEKKFVEKISRAEVTYVVFGASWCKPCVRLKKLLKDARVDYKIIFLDSSDIWVQKRLLKLEYHSIPYTVVYQNGKPTGVVRAGLGPSLIFLIANIDPK